MTRRFSPKAGAYTARLAAVQAEITKLKRSLAVLEEQERSLKAFLLPFYEEGAFEVHAEGADFEVKFATTERSYLDQDKVRTLLTKLGKSIPTFTSGVVTFRVNQVGAKKRTKK